MVISRSKNQRVRERVSEGRRGGFEDLQQFKVMSPLRQRKSKKRKEEGGGVKKRWRQKKREEWRQVLREKDGNNDSQKVEGDGLGCGWREIEGKGEDLENKTIVLKEGPEKPEEMRKDPEKSIVRG